MTPRLIPIPVLPQSRTCKCCRVKIPRFYPALIVSRRRSVRPIEYIHPTCSVVVDGRMYSAEMATPALLRMDQAFARACPS